MVETERSACNCIARLSLNFEMYRMSIRCVSTEHQHNSSTTKKKIINGFRRVRSHRCSHCESIGSVCCLHSALNISLCICVLIRSARLLLYKMSARHLKAPIYIIRMWWEIKSIKNWKMLDWLTSPNIVQKRLSLTFGEKSKQTHEIDVFISSKPHASQSMKRI